MKMTAKRKTELLVSWGKRHICGDAEAKWQVRFTEWHVDFTLELTLSYWSCRCLSSAGYRVSEQVSESVSSFASTKHKALNKMLSQLSERFDTPSSFEEMAIIEAVGA